MTIGKRIKGYRLKKGLKVKEFSEKIGISQGTLSDIENEKTKPSADTLSLIIRHADINPNWLLTGAGPLTKKFVAFNHWQGIDPDTGEKLYATNEGFMPESEVEGRLNIREGSLEEYFSGQPKTKAVKHSISISGYDKEAWLPVYTFAGAGTPKELTEYEPIETIRLPEEFGGPAIVTVKVRGESMMPTIWDGALCGVNTSALNIVSGEIYAFWLPYEGAVIKRAFVGYEKLILRSDNPMFPPIELPRQELDAQSELYRLLGRVDWIVQRRQT
ncbi:MAG: helix-turn-helix domain-containing protein [Nitrospiraceae bacterium]|nr:helix-turn-helix domain-containing protein [Nitrospiraceae bacterium]